MPGGWYANWTSAETNANRVAELSQLHREELADRREERHDQQNAQQDDADDHDDAQARQQEQQRRIQRQEAAALDKVRKSLRTVLSIIGKCVAEGHYNNVVRHSTSLEWIYTMLRSDYDIQQKGIHFFNLLDVKYDSEKMTPVSFYNQYRTMVTNNLCKQGDVIKYRDNLALEADEKMTPMLEDLVLLNVLREIDSRLPAFVRVHYNHKIKNDEKLMDFKSDILVNIPTFLEQIETAEQNNSMKLECSLHAFRQPQNQQLPR